MNKFKLLPPGISILLMLAVLTLNACNYPGVRTPTEPEPEVVYTSAAETVQAQLTQGIQPTVTIEAPVITPTTTPPLPTATSPGVTPDQPTNTSPALTTTSAPICDLAKFVSDVTIPDNTKVEPSSTFIKTWRLRNAGSCTWTNTYTLVYEGDNDLNAPASVPVTTGSVPPGGTVDVSVTLTAPANAGTYRQNFKLANSNGERFGLGDGTKPFWAQIKVVAPSGLIYDFIVQAASAEWKSGSGSTFDTTLTFGGADNDPNGVAKIKDGVTLETGAVSGKILLTYPKHTINGVIAGTYPPYLVQDGDQLKARVGFLAGPGGTCGAGNVQFQVGYQEGATTTMLGNWNKSCNGTLLPINLSLSSLAGKTIQLIFVVRASGDYSDDWAIWNSPRIER